MTAGRAQSTMSRASKDGRCVWHVALERRKKFTNLSILTIAEIAAWWSTPQCPNGQPASQHRKTKEFLEYVKRDTLGNEAMSRSCEGRTWLDDNIDPALPPRTLGKRRGDRRSQHIDTPHRPTHFVRRAGKDMAPANEGWLHK